MGSETRGKASERVSGVLPQRAREGSAFLYFITDLADELIYIGVARDLKSRIQGHRCFSPWFRGSADGVDWQELPEGLAYREERRLITERKPKFNIVHNPDRPKPSRKPRPTPCDEPGPESEP